MPIPDFDQYTEYVDTTGVHPVALEQHDLASPLTLAALAEGYAHVATLGRAPVMDATASDRLKVAASEMYHEDVVTHEIVSSDPAEVVDRLAWVRSRPEWRSGLSVAPDDDNEGVYYFEGNLYTVIQAHTTQADWPPDTTLALWGRFYQGAGIAEWVSGEQGLQVGDRRTYQGNIYEVRQNPGINIWPPPTVPALWLLIGPA